MPDDQWLMAIEGGDVDHCSFLYCDHPSRHFSESEVICCAEYGPLVFWLHLDCGRRHKIFWVARQNAMLN